MTTLTADYQAWPALPNLLPASFPGIKTGRDSLVIDIDYERLVQRLSHYFDPALSHRQIEQGLPQAMRSTKQFQAEQVRADLIQRGFVPDNILRYCYRPFDMRWLYWEPDRLLLDQSRPAYRQQPFKGNLWLEVRRKQPTPFDHGYVVHTPADHFGQGTSRFFPLYLSLENKQFSYFETDGEGLHPNLSVKAMLYAKALQVTAPNLFYHLVAMLHTPRYRQGHEAALTQDWPRLPLPNTKDALRRSALLGQKIVMLLNPEIKVRQVTTGQIRPDLALVGLLTRQSEAESVHKPDLKVTAGWGSARANGTVIPGPGVVVERDYIDTERAAIEKGGAVLGLSLDQLDVYLGVKTCDVYLNETTYWSNIPQKVWHYTLSGYPVIKKWLSYREAGVLGRAITPAEAEEVMNMARRITALRLMTPTLNNNYQAIKRIPYAWPD